MLCELDKEVLCFGCREHLLLGSHCSASALGAARPSEPFFAVPFGELQLPGGAQSSMASRARCDSVPRGQVLLGSLRPLPWGAGSGATPSLCQPLTSRPPAAGVLGENQFICCFLPITCLRGTDTSCAKPSACRGGWSSPCRCVNPILCEGSGAGWAPSCAPLACAPQLEELGDVCPQALGSVSAGTGGTRASGGGEKLQGREWGWGGPGLHPGGMGGLLCLCAVW